MTCIGTEALDIHSGLPLASRANYGMKRSAIHWTFDNKDVPAVQRFIGLVEFLFKFLQKLSEMREPLRRLTRRNASGSGLMSETKPSKRSTTLLKNHQYSSASARVDQQRAKDHGQPVISGRGALPLAERKYSQIEK